MWQKHQSSKWEQMRTQKFTGNSHRTIDNESEQIEAATKDVLWKKVFLKISKNSQENTWSY